jgi:hypothetical protein
MAVELFPADIPGAELQEPLEKHTVPALKWWLTCRNCSVPSSSKKSALISKIQQVVAEGKGDAVVDVDGSYLYKKYKRMVDAGSSISPLGPPQQPPQGWVALPLSASEIESSTLVSSLPSVTAGLVYTYLAGHIGCNSNTVGAFRALKQGYILWASGRLEKIEVNVNRPEYCHIRSAVKASMRKVTYTVYFLFHYTYYLSSVLRATCPCAAGQSASCIHVSAVLHALADLTPKRSIQLEHPEDGEEALPVTSRLCQWNVPRKRKESSIAMSEAVFQKHDY